jgi:hypothetical protein
MMREPEGPSVPSNERGEGEATSDRGWIVEWIAANSLPREPIDLAAPPPVDQLRRQLWDRQ